MSPHQCLRNTELESGAPPYKKLWLQFHDLLIINNASGAGIFVPGTGGFETIPVHV